MWNGSEYGPGFSEAGLRSTLSLFIKTDDPGRQFLVCCRKDEIIKNVCKIIANIYFKTFMWDELGEESDEESKDDYYYEKSQNNVVVVDHLEFNGFVLPALHKLGDLIEDKAVITAKVRLTGEEYHRVEKPKKKAKAREKEKIVVEKKIRSGKETPKEKKPKEKKEPKPRKSKKTEESFLEDDEAPKENKRKKREESLEEEDELVVATKPKKKVKENVKRDSSVEDEVVAAKPQKKGKDEGKKKEKMPVEVIEVEEIKEEKPDKLEKFRKPKNKEELKVNTKELKKPTTVANNKNGKPELKKQGTDELKKQEIQDLLKFVDHLSDDDEMSAEAPSPKVLQKEKSGSSAPAKAKASSSVTPQENVEEKKVDKVVEKIDKKEIIELTSPPAENKFEIAMTKSILVPALPKIGESTIFKRVASFEQPKPIQDESPVNFKIHELIESDDEDETPKQIAKKNPVPTNAKKDQLAVNGNAGNGINGNTNAKAAVESISRTSSQPPKTTKNIILENSVSSLMDPAKKGAKNKAQGKPGKQKLASSSSSESEIDVKKNKKRVNLFQ